MSKKSKIILLLILIMIIGYLVVNYFLYGGARNILSEQAEYEVTAKKINQEFATNIDSANAKYLEKAIEISGIVTNCKNHELIIDNTVICNLKNKATDIKVDNHVIVKGRIVGYDDLMGELKLDECTIRK